MIVKSSFEFTCAVCEVTVIVGHYFSWPFGEIDYPKMPTGWVVPGVCPDCLRLICRDDHGTGAPDPHVHCKDGWLPLARKNL